MNRIKKQLRATRLITLATVAGLALALLAPDVGAASGTSSSLAVNLDLSLSIPGITEPPPSTPPGNKLTPVTFPSSPPASPTTASGGGGGGPGSGSGSAGAPQDGTSGSGSYANSYNVAADLPLGPAGQTDARLGQSTAGSSRTGSLVESGARSTLLGSAPGQPLIIGGGPLGNDGLTILLMDSSSISNADGTSAANNNKWTLIKLAAGGHPLIVIDSQSGIAVAGAMRLPSPGPGSSLLVLDPVPGFAGVYFGETWTNTDGKSFAYGGTNIVRVSLLGDQDFLVLGHAATGASATLANGAGSDQGDEGLGGDDHGGPKPDPGPPAGSPPSLREPPAATPPDAGAPPAGFWPHLTRMVLPNTGAPVINFALIAIVLGILASYFFVPFNGSRARFRSRTRKD